MDLHITDPEFAERFEYFAFSEVPNEENQQLEEKTRCMVILGGTDRLRRCRRLQGASSDSLGKRRHTDRRKGDRLSGRRLYRLRQDAALSAYFQRGARRAGHSAAPCRAGHDNP